MNRRWQKDGKGRYETLKPSYGAFVASLLPLPSSMGICDSADLYAAYSVLHSKGRGAQVSANQQAGFYFFLAEASSQAQQGHAAAAAAGSGLDRMQEDPRSQPSGQTCTADGLQTSAQEQEQLDASGAHRATGAAAAALVTQEQPAAPVSPDQQPSSSSALFSKDGKRLEPVVPVSSKHVGLSMELLRRLFHLGGGLVVRHILLAIVDDDGSVSLIRMFNYIQPPFEGPETLPPLDGKADSEQDE